MNQFHENRLFETDQNIFYQRLKGDDRVEVPLPDPDAALEFWSGIWGYNREAGWIRDT